MKVSNAISSRTDTPNAHPKNGEYSSSTERFTLSGPSTDLDPRYHAYRGDLADAALASRLFAPHYARPIIREAKASAALYLMADKGSEKVGDLCAGEGFAALDFTGGWAWGYRVSDHLVGYIREDRLA